MVAYQYVCRCDCRYVGWTSQRLKDRINHLIPRCLRSDKRPTKKLPYRECKITSTPSVYCDSAMGQHLLENEECAKHYNDAQFSILATARASFHLSVLEATYINFLRPILCCQKEFVYSLQISHQFFFLLQFWLKRNNIFRPIKLPKWPILINHSTKRNFLLFCIDFILF